MEDSFAQHQLALQHPNHRRTGATFSAVRYAASFNDKIVRIVRSSIARMPEFNKRISYDIGLEGLPQIMDSSQPFLLRFGWILVILACLSSCLYQIYACGATYYAEPVAVDVVIREQEKLLFPSVTIINTESDGLYSMFNKASPNKSIHVGLESCINPVRELVDMAEGMSVENMWHRLNTSETITVLKMVTRKGELPLSVMEEYGMLGMQTKTQIDDLISYGGIHTKFVCEIRKIPDGCSQTQIMGSLQAHGMPTDLRTTWALSSLLALEMMFTMQKYEFVSRRKDPCVDKKAYFHCRTQCVVAAFKNFSCRFPFLPKAVALPTCIAGSRDSGYLYIQSAITLGRLTCSCPRICQETTFSISINFAGERTNFSSLSAYFMDNLMTVTKERFAYDVISLLSDIGGSLGLWLGFSVLSIVQFIQGLFKIACYTKTHEQKNRVPPLFRTDPIIRQVHQILNIEVQQFRRDQAITNNSPIVGLSTVMDGRASPILRMSWLIVIAVCLLGYCVFTYIRVTFYLSDPTHMKVEITKADKVQFPTITICGNNITGIKFFKKLAKKKKQFRLLPSGAKMPDWCSFQLTDLLDIPGMTAKLAWDMLSINGEFERAHNVGELLTKHKFLKNVVRRSVYLPDGKCSEFFIGEQDYAGTNTMFSKLTMSKLDGSGLYDEVVECDRSYNAVYFTPPNGTLQLNARLIYPKRTKTVMMLESKKVTLLNLRRKPCTDPQTANKCHTRCFEKMLLNRIPCRLPYMPFFDNITDCSTAAVGKKVQDAFMELSLTLDPFSHQNCSCIPSCTKTLIKPVVYVEPLDMLKMSLIGAIFFTNIQHHIFEETADSLPKLLCDLGGNLGLALGLSLLSIFEMIQSLGSLFMKV